MVRKRSFRNYFSFKYMITPDIIKIFHIIGLIILNLLFIVSFVGGIIFLFSGGPEIDETWIIVAVLAGYILAGIIVFFLVNIIWRVINEQLILFFSIHEILSTVDGNVGEINRKTVEPEVEEEEEEEEEGDGEEEDE